MSRDDDDDYDRPRRRRRRDDDYDDEYDDRPRRAKASGGGGTGVVVILGGLAGVLLLGCVICGGVAFFMAGPKVREAAARAKDTNNFRQVGLGVLAHNDVHDGLPPADGKLSWRVHTLPFVEQAALHQQFNLDQAWDSPRNQRHADVRIPPYVSSLDDPNSSQTRVRTFVGPDTLFPPGGKPVRVADVTDGISNTIFAAESADTVPWPAPRELNYSKTGPLPALGHPQRPGGFLVVMADGSVKFVRGGAGEATIRAGITPKGNDGPPDF